MYINTATLTHKPREIVKSLRITFIRRRQHMKYICCMDWMYHWMFSVRRFAYNTSSGYSMCAAAWW